MEFQTDLLFRNHVKLLSPGRGGPAGRPHPLRWPFFLLVRLFRRLLQVPTRTPVTRCSSGAGGSHPAGPHSKRLSRPPTWGRAGTASPGRASPQRPHDDPQCPVSGSRVRGREVGTSPVAEAMPAGVRGLWHATLVGQVGCGPLTALREEQGAWGTLRSPTSPFSPEQVFNSWAQMLL